MTNYQKVGGWAALGEAATYIAAFVILLALLLPAGYQTGDVDAAESVAFLADHQGLFYVWILIIYLLAGVLLVVLVLALHDRLKAGSAALSQTAAAFGLIWAGLILASGMIRVVTLGIIGDLFPTDPAQAETVWLALNGVQEGLGGAIELPGAIWVLLVSWAALRAGWLPKILNYLGIAIGVVGILTVVPALGELVSVFGIALIVWFIWLGIIMTFKKEK